MSELALNEYGTIVSTHICTTCGEPYTVCPPVDEGRWGTGCLATTCGSYDPKRDADKLFDDDDPRLRREER